MKSKSTTALLPPYLNEEMAESTRIASPKWSFGGSGIDRSLFSGSKNVLIFIYYRHLDQENIKM